MSQSDIPFSIAAELLPCRLIELPPDLLQIISSREHSNLEFKAPDAADSDSFLCTSDKTFHLRQVHTSNSLYLTVPDDADASAITAVSQCGTVLEALPAPNHHARSTLESLLTPFTSLEQLESSPPLHTHSKDHVFSHTPMSHGECQSVWEDLMAFECPASSSRPAQSFRPTAAALVNAWKWLLELAHIHALDLAHRPLHKHSLDAMLDGEDEWPSQLLQAIFLKLVHDDDSVPCFEKEPTIKWIGRNILEARHQNPSEPVSMDKSVFVDAWKDALPEAWRDHVTLNVLGNSYKLSAGGKKIEFAPDRIIQAGKDDVGASKSGAAAAGGKRKWHEKFAAARKQGKPS